MEAEELGARARNMNNLCFSPRPPLSWRPHRRSRGAGHGFLCDFIGSWDKAWAEGKEELATCRPRANSGRESRTVCTSV